MFARTLSRLEEPAYCVFRAVFGFLFSMHGMQKIFGVLTTNHPAVGSQIWVGGIIELVAGLLIAMGLITRCVAFVASGTMAVAYIQFHWRLQLGAQFFPVVNKGELAVLYCFAFLFIATRGAGEWSLDARRRARCS
jgi:putative oxidoreductase